MRKCHDKLDRKDRLQLTGLKLLCVVTAGARYVYFLQKTLVTFGSALTELHCVQVNQSGKPPE